MELKLTLKLRQPISEVALSQFYYWASALEHGAEAIAEAEGLPSADSIAQDSAIEEETTGFTEVDPMDRVRQHQAKSSPAEVTLAAAVEAELIPKRRGRKPRAALVSPEAGPPAEQAESAPPFPTAPAPEPVYSGPTLPAAAITPAAPIPPAMPSFLAPAAPVASASGDMPMDEFRRHLMEAQQASPGLPFRVMRANTWPDGAPQAWGAKTWSAVGAEGVPAAERGKLVEAMQIAQLMG